MTDKIKEFNALYDMPIAEYPGPQEVGDHVLRLVQLRKILMDEVSEIDPIIEKARALDTMDEVGMVDLLTDISDLMVDLCVYAQSEMVRWGLPYKEILETVMASNASKMGIDGKPIFADGKLMKGPNYWAPEPIIKNMLAQKRAEARTIQVPELQQVTGDDGISRAVPK